LYGRCRNPEAADDPGQPAAAAESKNSGNGIEGRVPRHVGLRSHPGRSTDMGILREHDEISLQADGPDGPRPQQRRAQSSGIRSRVARPASQSRRSPEMAAPPPPMESSVRSRSTPHRSGGPPEARPRGRQPSCRVLARTRKHAFRTAGLAAFTQRRTARRIGRSRMVLLPSLT
jgi:hypothetical protein